MSEGDCRRAHHTRWGAALSFAAWPCTRGARESGRSLRWALPARARRNRHSLDGSFWFPGIALSGTPASLLDSGNSVPASSFPGLDPWYEYTMVLRAGANAHFS